MNEQITTTGTDRRTFTVPLSATRRGARLARLLAVERLRAWGVPHECAQLVIAELASNAALHARVPGRSFRLTLRVGDAGTLRIEVTDARAGRVAPARRKAKCDGESGYGLLIVDRLADRWGGRARSGARKDGVGGAGSEGLNRRPGGRDSVSPSPVARAVKDKEPWARNQPTHPNLAPVTRSGDSGEVAGIRADRHGRLRPDNPEHATAPGRD